jgi:hypothetical protein
VIAACGTITSMAASSAAMEVLPSPEELPAHTVAVVSHIPVESRTITVKELGRALAQVAAQSGLRSTPAAEHPKHTKLEDEALGNLLEGLWIQGQAAEMEIVATDKQVATELAQIKEESFKTGEQFHAFLKRSHLTLHDVRYRVELQLLSARIQARIIRGATSQKQLRERLSDFLNAYNDRWRSRTVCAAQYVTERCSNGPDPKAEAMG